jgi:hypothetical protein
MEARVPTMGTHRSGVAMIGGGSPASDGVPMWMTVEIGAAGKVA